MAITNEEAITFANDRLRHIADLMARLYTECNNVNDAWIARGISGLIPDDGAEILHDSAYGTDGTDGDGRPIADGAVLNCIISGNIAGFITLLEANTNEKLNAALCIAVNPT